MKHGRATRDIFQHPAKWVWVMGLLLFISGACGGCGMKAPPVPMDSIVPKRIVDLQAIPREGRCLLTWTAPKENTDKAALKDLVQFKVLRSVGVLIADECRGCGEAPKTAYEMNVEAAEETRGKKISLILQDLEPRKVYVYQVVSVRQKGYSSAPSNPVTIYWDYPPAAPSGVRADRGDRKVDLSWDPVLGATGYNVYRKEEGKDFPLNPLNRAPFPEPIYTDLNVENEKRYFFSVRAVRRVAKTEVEGKGALEIPVTPTDLIPPGTPIGLTAVPLKAGIELNWRKNQDPDLLGYHLYRKKVGEETFKRVNDVPLTKETYLDQEVERDQEYDYAVTAVDTSVRKNESPLSEEVRVKNMY